MKRFKTPYSSVGYISEYLTHVGKLLSNVLKNKRGTVQFLAFADDEIFSKSSPILITVDAISSAILRIELADHRSANEWSNHYQALLENNFASKLLVSDAGTGLVAAHANTFPETPWQLDSFHGIAHRLGDWVRRLEKTAYAAIETVDKRIKTLASAKTDAVIDKRLKRCFEADKVVRQAIEKYDNFSYLYQYIIQQLNVFYSKGDPRHRDEVKENMLLALDHSIIKPSTKQCSP